MQSNMAYHVRPVQWGIISTASIGVTAVAPAILASSNGDLVAVASRKPQRAQELFAFAPQVHFYDNYERLLEDTNIEAIYIPLPNSLHAEWTIKSLYAGKHVLCEKPLAATAEQGKAMTRAAQDTGLLLMEAFMYRFHPQTEWALEQVAPGNIGRVRLVRLSFSFDIGSDPYNTRLQRDLAGGSLMDVGCYLINFCRAIYGHAPQDVDARVYVPVDSSVEHAVNAILDFGEERFGLIDTSFDLPFRQTVEIVGERGIINLPTAFPPKNVETVALLTLDGQTLHHRFTPVDHYQREVEHFAHCIRSKEPPKLSLMETIENLATMEAIYQAAGYTWHAE